MIDVNPHTAEYFRNSVLIMAHPDDEIIFASSIIQHVSKIIVCFGPVQESHSLTSGREKIISQYPFQNITFLNIPQSRFEHVNAEPIRFHQPRMNSYGITGGCSPKDYEMNFAKLYDLFFDICQDYSTVFSHNPWGEYGNHEHIQIFRILSGLQKRFNFNLFVSGYVTARTMQMAEMSEEYISSNFLMLKTNLNIYHEIKDLYMRNDCWTWFNDFQPPSCEYYLQVNNSTDLCAVSPNKHCYPLTYIRHCKAPRLAWYINLLLDLSLYVPLKKIVSFFGRLKL